MLKRSAYKNSKEPTRSAQIKQTQQIQIGPSQNPNQVDLHRVIFDSNQIKNTN